MAKPGRPETDLEHLEDVLRSGGMSRIEYYLRKLPSDPEKYINKIEKTLIFMSAVAKDFKEKL